MPIPIIFYDKAVLRDRCRVERSVHLRPMRGWKIASPNTVPKLGRYAPEMVQGTLREISNVNGAFRGIPVEVVDLPASASLNSIG